MCALQESGRKCWLVSEIMTGGTLAHWLHGDKGPLGPNKTLLQRVEKALEVGVCTRMGQGPWTLVDSAPLQ